MPVLQIFLRFVFLSDSPYEFCRVIEVTDIRSQWNESITALIKKIFCACNQKAAFTYFQWEAVGAALLSFPCSSAEISRAVSCRSAVLNNVFRLQNSNRSSVCAANSCCGSVTEGPILGSQRSPSLPAGTGHKLLSARVRLWYVSLSRRSGCGEKRDVNQPDRLLKSSQRDEG